MTSLLLTALVLLSCSTVIRILCQPDTFDQSGATFSNIKNKTTISEPPDEITTLRSPDKSTVESPDVTTAESSNETAAVESRHKSTVESPEKTTVESWNETTVQTTENATTVESLDDITAVEVSDETTTVETPAGTTILEIPDETTTVESSNETTNTEVPFKLTTAGYLNSTTTVESPDKTTTVESSHDSTTVKSPNKTTIAESPIKTTTVETPLETTTFDSLNKNISINKTTTTVEFSHDTTNVEYPHPHETTTVKSPNKTTSVESSPNETTTVVSSHDTSSVDSPNKTITLGFPNKTITVEPTKNNETRPKSNTPSPNEMCIVLYAHDAVKLKECLSALVDKSTESASQETKQDELYKTAVNITRYLSPIVIVIGTVLNILSFIVLAFTKMNRNSSSVYLASLSVTDTLNLWLNLTRHWIIAVWTLDFRDKHIVLCKLSAFFAYYLPHVSAWIIVAVTLERVVYVCLPLRAKFICTKRNNYIALVAIFCIFIVINGFIFEYQGPFKGRLCNRISDLGHTYFRVKIWPHLDMVLSSLLPFSILMIGNGTIIFSRVKAALWKAKTKASSNSANTPAIDKQTISVTLMLLCISFVFIILTLPITIHFYIFGEVVGGNPNNYGEIKLSEVITLQVYFINCGINFVLYCISGAFFREQLRVLLGISKKARGTQGPSSSQATTDTSRL